MSIIPLKLPNSGKITEIIHISDIHIRNGDEIICRFHEYKFVFMDLFEKLKKIASVKRNSAVIVITGDTFHNKSRLETPGIKLFMILIKELGNICPVYIILGNHDFKQDQIENNIDFLDAFNENIHCNVTYLKETGLYQAGNVGFGLFSVKDSLELGSGSGINKNLKSFPLPIFDENVTIKIALFHGTMIHSKFSNSRKTEEGYSWNWLDIGYDLALLGDIHKRQIFPEKKSGLLAAYSGSLIQQNYGESILDHGILLWNFETPSKIVISGIDITNDYGFLKLTIENGIWYCEKSKLEDLILNPQFPNILKIRIFGNYTIFDLNNLHYILKRRKYILDEYCIKSNESIVMNKFNNDDLINSYMNEIKFEKEYNVPSIEELYVKSREEWTPSLRSNAHKKNLEIDKHYNIYKTTIESTIKNKTLKLKYLEWCDILCFSGQNWFDFELTNGNTNLISAENGGGKSNFLEIICLSIFGKTFPSRNIKGSSSALICKYKKSNTDSYTSIQIIHENNIYKINRYLDKNGKLKSTKGGVYLLESNKWKTICLGNPKIKQWVLTNLGNIDEFMMKNIVSQANDGDFLSMKSSDQRSYLEEIFGLKVINAKVNLFKQLHTIVRKFRNDVNMFFDGCKSLIKPEYNKDELDAIQAIYNTVKEEINLLESKLIKSWGKCDINDLKLSKDEISKKVELLCETVEYEVTDETNIIHEITNVRLKKKYLESSSCEILQNMDKNIEYNESCSVDCVSKPNKSKTQCNELINGYNTWNKVPKLENNEDTYLLDLKENTFELKLLLEERDKLVYVGEKPNINYEECVKEKHNLEKQILHQDSVELVCENKLLEEISFLENIKELECNKHNNLSKDLFIPQISLEKIANLLNYVIKNERKHTKLLAEKAIFESQKLLWDNHVEKVDTNTQNIEKTEIDLSNILKSLKNVPFNPECSACCQQPLRIQYENTSKLQHQFQKESEKLLQLERNVIIPNDTIIKKTNDWIVEFNNRKALFSEYTELEKKWELYRTTKNKIDAVNKKINNTSVKLDKTRKLLLDKITIRQNKIRLHELINKIETYENSLKYYENKQIFTSKIQNIEKKISDLKSTINLVDCENAETASWNALFIITKSSLEDWKKYEYYFLHKYEKEIKNLNDMEQNLCIKLSNIKNEKNKEKQHKYWTGILKYQNKFEMNSKNIEKIKYLRSSLEQIHGNLKIYEHGYSEELKNTTKLEVYNENIRSIDEKVSNLKKMEDFYDNYSIWLYKNHIVPKLVTRTNKFISNIESSIKLECIIQDDGNFVFFVRNNDVDITLEKLSGFEYFIVAICLRLAFVTLTTKDNNLGGQFIIDEGFTACDKNHLQKIPTFLQSLLIMFDSIILVSHLEFINESVDNRFYIKEQRMKVGKCMNLL